MANTNNPNGFQPYSGNGSFSPRIGYYQVNASNSEIKQGDPVTLTASELDKAAAGNALIGVAAQYLAANSGGKIAVYDDPSQKFVAQADDGGSATINASTHMGLNANFIAATNSGRKRSNAQLDQSTGANTATLPFKVERLEPVANNAFGTYNRLICSINNHQLKGGTGTSTGA